MWRNFSLTSLADMLLKEGFVRKAQITWLTEFGRIFLQPLFLFNIFANALLKDKKRMNNAKGKKSSISLLSYVVHWWYRIMAVNQRNIFFQEKPTTNAFIWKMNYTLVVVPLFWFTCSYFSFLGLSFLGMVKIELSLGHLKFYAW